MFKKFDVLDTVKVGDIFSIRDSGPVHTSENTLVKVAYLGTYENVRFATFRVGNLVNNEYVATETFGARKLSTFRQDYPYKWTPDVPELKMGDVLESASGEYFMVALNQSAEKAIWRLKTGQFARIRPSLVGWTWGSLDIPLKLSYTADGNRYSGYFIL